MDNIESVVNYKELYYQERERRLELEQQLERQKVLVKKYAQSAGVSKMKNYCALCFANLTSKSKDDGSLIQELKGFSEKLSAIQFPSAQCLPPSLLSNIHQDNTKAKSHVGMIENATVFGIKESIICQSNIDTKMGGEFDGEILYSMKQKNDIEMQASKLVFPSGMTIKKYFSQKAKDKTIELMSYCYTNLKSFVLNFECPDPDFDDHFHHNELLNHINPEHRLFCICIGINDYTCVNNPNSKFNLSLGLIEGPDTSQQNSDDGKIRSEGNDRCLSSDKGSLKSFNGSSQNTAELQIRITQRVFCIMSYYPFFSFFEQILKNLINIVKMERLAIYKHYEENVKQTIKQTDSTFQIGRMVELFELCYKDLQHKKISFNQQYELRLINQQKITLLTYWDDAKVHFTREWIYSVLSMFNFDNFLDLFTLIMLEDRVVFICQNSHILTYTIYLFSHVLTKPLKYSFPIVSIIPSQDEDFLNAPFPVVYGLLKKRKALEDKRILQNYDNTYVFLSPEKVEIMYQEDRRQILNNRSTKLSNMKQLKEIFKELKKTRKKQQKTSKYEVQSSEYCILANPQQKQKGLKIVALINQYINDEIVTRLPSQVKLQNMKKKKADLESVGGEKDEHSQLMNAISSQMRRTVKDPFIQAFLNTQMINNYLFK